MGDIALGANREVTKSWRNIAELALMEDSATFKIAHNTAWFCEK
jgi:hypothetical protein